MSNPERSSNIKWLHTTGYHLSKVYCHPTHLLEDKVPVRHWSGRLFEGMHGGQPKHFPPLSNLKPRHEPSQCANNTWTAVVRQSKQETVKCSTQTVSIGLRLQDAHCFGLLKKPLSSLLLISCTTGHGICLRSLDNSSVSVMLLTLA